VDFSKAEQDNVPSGISNSGIITNPVDTNQFFLFTNYTGTTTVTESTTDSDGNTTLGTGIGNWTNGTDATPTSSSAYTSYNADNGFEVDTGALDTNIGGSDTSTNRLTDPEDDLALASKTTALNFNIADQYSQYYTDDTNLMLAAVQDDLNSLTKMASNLGGLQSELSSEGTFNSALADTLTSGIGSLVDADMNQASTRLNALQTQQQLGIQALSIANNNSQLILKLFAS
jgi:flagellin